MGGGGKGGGGGEAAAARRDEQERQQRIREGTARINKIFDGTTVGDNLLTAGTVYDPTKTYYTADGQVWNPGTGATDLSTALTNRVSNPGNGLATSDPATSEAVWRMTNNGASGAKPMPDFSRASDNSPVNTTPADPAAAFAEALAGGKLYGGTKNTGGFNDDFFDSRKQAYIDYATPQLEDQYSDAQKQLTYALARSGNLDSSARGEKVSELQKKYDLNKQKVADDALSYSNQARTSVEDARSNLVATLNATGDAEGAANQAMARAGVLSQPVAFNPLSQLFADFTAGLGTQAAQERANAVLGDKLYPVPYKTGLFTPGRISVT